MEVIESNTGHDTLGTFFDYTDGSFDPIDVLFSDRCVNKDILHYLVYLSFLG